METRLTASTKWVPKVIMSPAAGNLPQTRDLGVNWHHQRP